jgi:hypothetical protein
MLKFTNVSEKSDTVWIKRKPTSSGYYRFSLSIYKCESSVKQEYSFIDGFV